MPYSDVSTSVDLEPVALVLAGAARIGREAAGLVAVPDRHVAVELLASEALFDALAADMGGALSGNRSLLSAYRDGFG